MYCQQCGTEIPEGQNVCPGCYAPVSKPGLLRRILGALFGRMVTRAGAGDAFTRRADVTLVENRTRIEITDADGGKRVYNSLDEAPPEIRAKIEAFRSGADAGQPSQAFTFRDASGQERTYHSVDEMPPEVREIYERIREQRGLGR